MIWWEHKSIKYFIFVDDSQIINKEMVYFLIAKKVKLNYAGHVVKDWKKWGKW